MNSRAENDIITKKKERKKKKCKAASQHCWWILGNYGSYTPLSRVIRVWHFAFVFMPSLNSKLWLVRLSDRLSIRLFACLYNVSYNL